ncbi:MAG TPA: bifunctional DNA-formamidopyrimidine glycosylase/DNA-(apurinic or apyrimidinic site) lyase [Gemmatimonadales bacterium]|jgi:formamidopyrimidine-DNA glycosylase|nr:bifunctional DNA-formamidopyrimidine glycosylase/DNA-(apurinic or apyrimidinic site) lyase [Gemmatimonadales bacterium]
MPELPEVETIVRDIRPELVGRRIVAARLEHDDVLRGVSRRSLLSGLRGSRVRKVFRRAKHAVLETDTRRLVVQPGMTGSLMVLDRPPTPRERAYTVLRAELDTGRELIFHDVRRFGTLLWLDPEGWELYTAALGPEPLDPAFGAQELLAILRRSRAAVKKVLMDQGALAGVGNIYAQEALFAAGIDPSKPAREVSPPAARRLHRHLIRILKAAIESEGTTVRDYRTGTGKSGSFQFELLVYDREGEPCVRCGTALAGTHAIDARITVFCHRCQS